MRKLLFLSVLLVNSVAFGLQIKPVKNNQTVSAFVAKKDKTRLFVSGDRISRLHGTPNAYSFTNDNIHGQVYIMPTPGFQSKSFSVFITTELGNTYGLKLTPVDRAADSIMLKPHVNKKLAAHWESASSYHQSIVELIRYMVNDIAPEGYGTVKVHQKKPYYLGHIATLTLDKVYNGVHLRGERYCLHNQLNKPITVTETEFYRPGTRAIAINQHTIPAHGNTTLYGVMGND